MAGETMAELLFRSLWRKPRKSTASGPDRGVIGILSFEVASSMSKLANLWHCLEDREILRLREVVNSPAVKKFVSEDVDYLMDLSLMEVMENLGYVARAVVMLGKRCADPTYHHLKQVFDNPVEIDLKWCGWEYRLKKMERKVKKMERFVAATSQLYQELEVLVELEQTLRRMQANPNSNQVKLLEFQQKVMWQRQEVKNLRKMSPWVRTYDYTVKLLLRSIFTIFARIKLVREPGAADEVPYCSAFPVGESCLVRSNSFSALMQSSILPPRNNPYRYHSAHLERSLSNLGLAGEKNWSNFRKLHARRNSFAFGGKQQPMKTIGFAHVGPFKGCMTVSNSPGLPSFLPSCSDGLRSDVVSNQDMNTMKSKGANFQLVGSSGTIATNVVLPNFNHKILNPPSSTLGHAALALHYANVIVLIERLISSAHLISMDARDDLYNMLPASIRASLRTKLKVFTKTLTSSVYDAAFAAEWRSVSSRILDWLLPLALNTIKWYSERNFEKQHITPGTNVLLVQTLYFADQVRTEAATAELLLGLNYLSRSYSSLLVVGCGRELDGSCVVAGQTDYRSSFLEDSLFRLRLVSSC